MQLLVSVADASEARAALLGGADVIDAKDPRDGALGAVRVELLGALRSAIGAGRPLGAAHGAGLFACLAGSLRGADFATACALGADVVGVRGAACVGGRTGRVSRARVTALSALARSAPLAAAALV